MRILLTTKMKPQQSFEKTLRRAQRRLVLLRRRLRSDRKRERRRRSPSKRGHVVQLTGTVPMISLHLKILRGAKGRRLDPRVSLGVNLHQVRGPLLRRRRGRAFRVRVHSRRGRGSNSQTAWSSCTTRRLPWCLILSSARS